MRRMKPMRISLSLLFFALLSFSVNAASDVAVLRSAPGPRAIVFCGGSIVLLLLVVMLATARERVKCPNCEAKCPKYNEVCAKCGYSFITKSLPIEPSTAILCPACSDSNPVGSKCCKSCGKPL